ncbi:MAG: hypothetical protein AB7N73_13990 [Gemmatimonadales bacterium]
MFADIVDATFNVSVVLVPEVEDGEKLPVIPDGLPWRLNPTAPVKPPLRVIVTDTCPELPWSTVRLDGLAARLKSGDATAATLKGALVEDGTPGVLAMSLYPCPARSTVRLENLAMPPTALVVTVPERPAPVEFALS